jgi:hypothetical protein
MAGAQAGANSTHTTAFWRAASPNHWALRFGDPLLGVEVDVDQAESVAEAVHPLEVVLGAPEELPVDRYALRRRPLELS